MEKEEKKNCKDEGCKDGNCSCSKNSQPILIGLAAIILVIAGLLIFKPFQKTSDVISLEDAKVKAESFINENFVDPNFPVSIVSIEEAEERGLYKINIDIGDGEIVELFISNDGKKFYPQAFDMEELASELNEEEASTSTPETAGSDERFSEGADFSSDKKTVVYFFWGEGCSHCSNQKAAMSEWLDQYPDMEIKTYETWSNSENGILLESMAAAYGQTVQGVPMTFIGDEFWVGYADSLGAEMIEKIEECEESSCENPGERLDQ
jgi:thiol-disulfide isomerase/thioredoxin